MTRLRMLIIAFGVTLAGTALAQSPPVDDKSKPDDPDTTSETDADRTGQDRTDPSDPNAPTPEQTQTDDRSSTAPTVQDPSVYVAPTTTVETVVEDDDDDDRLGFAIAAGGGASGFTNETLRDTTNVGGEWGVRLTLGTRSPIALEASYIGSAQPISALGVDDNAVLLGNGVQAALRLNTTIDLPVQPFLFAGAAWRRYDLSNTDVNTSDLNDTDNVLEVPLGAGIAARYEGFIFDLRGEFRIAADEDLLPEIAALETDNDFATMHRWGANASVGYEF